MPMVNIAVSGMSVDAARANPITAASEARINAESSWEPGRKRRMKIQVARTISEVIAAVGTRAAQS